MKRIKDVDYNVEMYTSAKQYLFEDEGLDGSFRDPSFQVPEDDACSEEIQIENFKNELQKNWGEQESKLRTAIYVSFVKDTDTNLLRKNSNKGGQHSKKSMTSLEQS